MIYVIYRRIIYIIILYRHIHIHTHNTSTMLVFCGFCNKTPVLTVLNLIAHFWRSEVQSQAHKVPVGLDPPGGSREESVSLSFSASSAGSHELPCITQSLASKVTSTSDSSS